MRVALATHPQHPQVSHQRQPGNQRSPIRPRPLGGAPRAQIGSANRLGPQRRNRGSARLTAPQSDVIICTDKQMKIRPRTALSSLLAPEFFRALGDANRLTLLDTLAQRAGPVSVGELGGCCSIDLSVVSRHLAVLRKAGVLEATRRGKQVFYRARLRQLAQTLRAIADSLDECCARGPGDANEDAA